MTLKHGAKHQELDMFNLESDGELTPAALGVRPGNELVMIRNSNTLYNLGAVLDRINPHLQDVVVLHLRVMGRAGSGENELAAEDLFSVNEQELFTRALSLAEKKRKVHSSGGCSRIREMGRNSSRSAEPAIVHHCSGNVVLESDRGRGSHGRFSMGGIAGTETPT